MTLSASTTPYQPEKLFVNAFHALVANQCLEQIHRTQIRLDTLKQAPLLSPAPPLILDALLSARHPTAHNSQQRTHALTLITPQKAYEALQTDATSVRILSKNKSPQEGQLVGARLNLNVLKNTGVAVQTLHQASNRTGYTRGAGFFRGEAIDYQPVVFLQDAYFNVDQTARAQIATGKSAKFAMASIDGNFMKPDSQWNSESFDAIEVMFNPMRVHLFVDTLGRAVKWGKQVVLVGHRAYVMGDIEYFTEHNMPSPQEGVPSSARPLAFNEAEIKLSDSGGVGTGPMAKSR